MFSGLCGRLGLVQRSSGKIEIGKEIEMETGTGNWVGVLVEVGAPQPSLDYLVLVPVGI